MEQVPDYEVIKILGKGSFGTVYHCLRKSDRQPCAVKVIDLATASNQQKRRAFNEAKLLSSLSNPHIIQFLGASYNAQNDGFVMAMEFAESGDLNQKIQEMITNNTSMAEDNIWYLIRQVSTGLAYLKQRNILHRDLKPANILQMEDGTYKIADLNVSRLAVDGLADTQIGTPFYACPQIWQSQVYDNKADIWSLGAIAYELCSLKSPFQATTKQQLYKKISKAEIRRIPAKYSESLWKLIKSMLDKDPLERPEPCSIIATASKAAFQKCASSKQGLQSTQESPKRNRLSSLRGNSDRQRRRISRGGCQTNRTERVNRVKCMI